MAREHFDVNDPDHFVLYRYTPSLEAAIIFVIAFSITTILHLYQLIRTRTWYFIPLAIGGIFESVGYVGRILGHRDQWDLNPFILQSLLLLVAPALFAASIYMTLGRIILMVDGERYSMIRARWLTKLFVAGDVLSFFVQGGGAGIQASKSENSMKLGNKIIIAGLFIQLLFFGFFVLVAAVFHKRLLAARPELKLSPTSLDALPWKRHMYVLYATSGLILLRSVFRVIEYLMGNAGYLLKHEVFLYIFDAVLMWSVLVIFNVVHPSEVMEKYRRRLASGSMEGAEVELVQRVSEDRRKPYV